MEVSSQDAGARVSPSTPVTSTDDGELLHLLRDIDRLAEQLRKTRNTPLDKRASQGQVRALEADLRAKWEAVRTLRAKRSQVGGPLSASRPRLSRGPLER